MIYPLSAPVDVLGGIQLTYSDDYFTDSSLASFLEQDAYLQVDARIGLEDCGDRWSVSLIGTNLTEEEILDGSQVFLANAGYLKNPRTVRLQGNYRF
jgi:iron complex outermembrane recepter protein